MVPPGQNYAFEDVARVPPDLLSAVVMDATPATMKTIEVTTGHHPLVVVASTMTETSQEVTGATVAVAVAIVVARGTGPHLNRDLLVGADPARK